MPSKPRIDLSRLLTLADVEEASEAVLDEATWAYLAGGAGDDRTVRGNVAAFESVWLRPRVLEAGSTTPDTGVTLLGRELSMPILLAPTSPMRLMHEDAELAVARAATREGVCSIVSTDTQHPFPEIAAATDECCWFQLYCYRSKRDIEATIDMAQEAGASALVVTVDAYYSARRIRTQRAGFSTPDFVDFGTLRALGVVEGEIPPGARFDRLPLTWEDIEWIRERASVPLLIKGVLHPADARRCVEAGADGVIVSNHGGRQLDGVVPSIVALEQIAPAVRDDCTVLVDGGIRSGVDVVKALALGAHAACIGRPYLWGLSIAGDAGVEAVLAMLRRELEDALRQLGVGSVAEVDGDSIASIRWSPITSNGRPEEAH
jgi:4-hydroxymandelate oxidase